MTDLCVSRVVAPCWTLELGDEHGLFQLIDRFEDLAGLAGLTPKPCQTETPGSTAQSVLNWDKKCLGLVALSGFLVYP